jgi:CBS domain containing-hemolysin-like protein
LQSPENTSLTVARPTLWTEAIFKPAIWALNGAGNALLRLVGIKPASAREMVHSVEELKMIVTASMESGMVKEEDSEMLHAIFDLRELLVRQVMVPRTEILAVEANASLDELVSLVTQTTFTKIPVFEENLDKIIGILYVRDLLRVINSPDGIKYTARALVRDALFVPETIQVNDLLHQFRTQRQHIAIILDEYGGTAGLVTLEDLLEEIVGEVHDPFDVSAPEIQAMEDGSVLIDGMALIEEVNEELNLALDDPYYDTIAGFVLGQLGHIPRVGEVVEKDGIRLRVEKMDERRIASLSLERLPPPAYS